jgi:thioredoxin-related protein
MKNAVLTLLIIISCSAVFAQHGGMQFVNNVSWKAVLEKAKKEHKFIFVDCATTWCGPCKYMSKNIFPMDSVGDFYNAKFICTAFQLDTTGHDDAEIQARYQDASFIAVNYKIRAYPTYLYFNPEGELVTREGGSSDAEAFLTKGRNALDPQKQYYTQQKLYNDGKRDSAFLRALTFMAINAFEDSAARVYFNSYYPTQKNLLVKENLEMIFQVTQHKQDTGFALMVNNLETFEQVIPKEQLLSYLENILFTSEISGSAIHHDWTSAQLEQYSQDMKKKYPMLADAVLAPLKTMFYLEKQDWKNFAVSVDQYAASPSPAPDQLNNYAWTVFTKCDDKSVIESALVWSKKSFEGQNQNTYNSIDTYANLLYKLGRNQEAIDWEMKAQQLALTQGGEKQWNQDVIDKMKKGEKTW